jgi:hypothetical protein
MLMFREIVESWKKARCMLEEEGRMHQEVATKLKEEVVTTIAEYINESESKMVNLHEIYERGKKKNTNFAQQF